MDRPRALCLRRGRPGDAEAIATLHAASWQTTYPGLLPAELLARATVEALLPRRRAHLAAETATSATRTWVVVAGGGVRGFAVDGPARLDGAPGAEDELTGAGELYAIYLQPGWEGRGLGVPLARVALAELRGRGFPEAIVWVLAANERARRFYGRLGFQRDGGRTETVEGFPAEHWRMRVTF